MITIKSPAEFDKMAVAGAAVAAVLRVVREAAAPGVSMRELDALAAEVLKAHDCTASFLGYHGFPAHICTSPNSTIVHGIPGGYRLRQGDILSLDAGAVYQGFHGDAAVTVAIGEVAPEARRLIDVTRQALYAGIAATVEGARVGDIGAAVQAEAEAAGYGIVQQYVGHGIGRRMHEEPQVPNYGVRGKGLKLRTGMAICIEPMFNLGGPDTRVEADNWTVVTADGSLSAHFEHTVALTHQGSRVFTLSEEESEADLVQATRRG